MPRVVRDIDQILAFIERQPWGDPAGRIKDIRRGVRQIVREPRRNKVRIRRRTTGVELRRHNIAQFAIIYAYVPPNAEYPRGLVSIRAVLTDVSMTSLVASKNPARCIRPANN